MDIKHIYKRMIPEAKKDIIGSVTAGIRASKDDQEMINVKIVFVKDRHSKNWLAVLSADINLDNEEIIRIYCKRWGGTLRCSSK